MITIPTSRRFTRRQVSLDPPLPVYLFHLVAGLRDKSTKGYPIKKVNFRMILMT